MTSVEDFRALQKYEKEKFEEMIQQVSLPIALGDGALHEDAGGSCGLYLRAALTRVTWVLHQVAADVPRTE